MKYIIPFFCWVKPPYFLCRTFNVALVLLPSLGTPPEAEYWPDAQSQSSPTLLRGGSLEELVQSPHSLPLDTEGAPLSLKVCLVTLFERGWSPEPGLGGMARLAEDTILWLKSIEKLDHVPLEDFPEVIQELLKSFRKLAGSTKTLEEIKDRNQKRAAIANKAVETRYQEFVTKVKEWEPEQAKDAMSKQKVVLQEWLQKAMEKGNREHEEHISYHLHVRERFESEIQDLINQAYTEYKNDKNRDLDAKAKLLNIDAASLEASLDMELEEAMGNLSLDSEPIDPVPTATSVFVQLQDVIGKTLAESDSIPEALKEKLVENVQGMFKDAFQAKPSGAETKKPNQHMNKGEAGTTAETEDQGNENVNAENGAPRVAAVEAELRRADTSQIEQQELEKDQVVVDGVVMYKTQKGKFETLEERQARLAHNSYMRFSRSFTGNLAALRGIWSFASPNYWVSCEQSFSFVFSR